MSQFLPLLKKEFTLEMRQKHALAGIVMYVLATVFVCYLSLEKIETPRIWGAMLWLTGIFTAFNTMQKAFVTEGQGTVIYLYTMVSPQMIILSKVVYNAFLVALLNLVSVFFFIVFFGMTALEGVNLPQFVLGILLGSTGLGLALTFIAGLAYKSGTGGGLVAVLGFPVVIPILITMVRYTTFALEGKMFIENSLNLLVLVVLNIVSLVLAYVLFPYLWRD